MNDNLTTNASNEAENPAFLVAAVSGSFYWTTQYYHPDNNFNHRADLEHF